MQSHLKNGRFPFRLLSLLVIGCRLTLGRGEKKSHNHFSVDSTTVISLQGQYSGELINQQLRSIALPSKRDPSIKLLLILQDLTRSHLGDIFPRQEASLWINNVTNPYFLVSHYRVDQDLLSITTDWLNVWFPARLMSFLRAQQVLLHLEIATPQTPGYPCVAVQERAFELKWGTIPM